MFNLKRYKEQIKQLNKEKDELIAELEQTRITLNDLSSENKRNLELLSNSISESIDLKNKYQCCIDLDNIKKEILQEQQNLYDVKRKISLEEKNLDYIKKSIVDTNEKFEVQTMGLYDLKYPNFTTVEFKENIEKVRYKMNRMLIEKKYYSTNSDWSVNGSYSQGNKLAETIAKQFITSFNLTMDALLDKVTLGNVKSTKDKITKIFLNYNKSLNGCDIKLNNEYLDLVIEQIDLKFSLALKKQEEKEEREYQKAIIREQEKAEKELKQLNDKLLKEKEKYENQLSKGKDVQDKLDEINSKIKEAEYKRENTLSGYVYIISNPSLGEDIYKIGVTRRLDPMDRIRELSSASVPFKFSPHCILFTDNAYKLENDLHKEFDKYRVNKINKHKEYFKLPLSEIERVIKEKYNNNAIFDYDIIDENYLLSI